MNKNYDKITLLTKPEQSGKTFLMLQKIVECFSEEPRDDGRVNINFIICDNNLLLVLQTSKRINNDESLNQFRNIETGVIYVEFSSSKRTITKTSDSIYRLITSKKVSNIICCSNGTRCDDILNIIKDINKYMGHMFHFNIWYDEADKFNRLIRKYIVPVLNDYDNVSLFLITATPKRTIQEFGEIKIWPIQNPTSKDYHSWNDNKIKSYSNNICSNTYGFVNYILNKHKKHIKRKTKWFIPAGAYKKSHMKVKDICMRKEFATMIINGDGIKIYMPNGRVYDELKNEMPSTLIPKIYNKYKLYKYPFAITGLYCISRGISISSNNFMLTHGIMPFNIRNKSEASQIAGRMKGNHKHWANYKKPIIFCTKKFDNIAKEMEKKTISLAKLAFEENWETVTLEKFKTVEKDYYAFTYPEPFITYQKAIKYLKTQETHIGKLKKKRGNSINSIHQCGNELNGFYVSSRMMKKKIIMEDNDNEATKQRLIKSKFDSISEGYNLSAPNKKGQKWMIYPVYENLSTPWNEVKYYVRHIKKRKKTNS